MIQTKLINGTDIDLEVNKFIALYDGIEVKDIKFTYLDNGEYAALILYRKIVEGI